MQVRVKILPLEVRSKSGPALQYIIKIETSNTSRLPQMVSPSFSTFCSQAKSYRKKMKQNIRLCILLIAVQNWNLCNPTDLPRMKMPWRTERKIFWYYLLVHSRENRLTAFHPWGWGANFLRDPSYVPTFILCKACLSIHRHFTNWIMTLIHSFLPLN